MQVKGYFVHMLGRFYENQECSAATGRQTPGCACGAIGQRGPEGGKAMARGQRIVLWIGGLPASHLTKGGEACHASLPYSQLRY